MWTTTPTHAGDLLLSKLCLVKMQKLMTKNLFLKEDRSQGCRWFGVLFSPWAVSFSHNFTLTVLKANSAGTTRSLRDRNSLSARKLKDKQERGHRCSADLKTQTYTSPQFFAQVPVNYKGTFVNWRAWNIDASLAELKVGLCNFRFFFIW